MLSRGPFSTANYLHNPGLQVGSGVLFIAGWIRRTLSAVQTIYSLCDSAGDTIFVRLWLSATNTLGMTVRDGASIVSSTNTATAVNTWIFVAGAFSPGNWVKSWHGTNLVTTTTTVGWPAGLDRTAIGVRYSLTLANPFSGQIGALGVWQAEPAAAEIAAMAAGRDFRQYTTADLLSYYAMRGTAGEKDLVGSFDFSEAGAVPEFAGGPAIHRLPLRLAVNAGLDVGVQTRT